MEKSKYIYPNNHKFIEEDIIDIVKEYQEGNCIDVIRKKYHCRNTTISNILKKEGIKIKKTYEYRSPKELATNRKYYCNENIFESIDNPDKAYWFGFILADGNISNRKGKTGGTKGIRISIGLSEKDHNHLESFSHFVQSNYPIRNKTVKLLGKEYLSCEISIGSVKMGNDLIEKGCAPQKSLSLKYPSCFDDKYFPDFVRGYFDGDGCVSFKKYNYGTSSSVTMLGTYEFLSVLDKKLKDNGINSRRGVAKTASKAYVLEISAESHEKFYRLIYGNNPTYFLNRKREKYNSILQYRNMLKAKQQH